MKEQGRSLGGEHFVSSQSLTARGQNPYARSGEIYNMAEGNGGLIDQHGRPIGETSVDVNSLIDFPATTPEQIQSKNAWRQAHGGMWPRDPNERQTLGQMIQQGIMPSVVAQNLQGAPQFQSEMPRERKRELKDAWKQGNTPLQNEDMLSDEEFDEAKSHNIDLQSDEVRQAHLTDLVVRVNNVDTLGYTDVKRLYEDINKLSTSTLFKDEDQLPNMISAVGARLSELNLEEKAREDAIRQGLPDTPEIISQLIEQRRPMRRTIDIIQERKRHILSSEITDENERVKDIRNNYIWLKRYVSTAYESAEGGSLQLSPETKQRLKDIIDKDPASMTEEEIKAQTLWLTQVGADQFNIQQYFVQVPGEKKGGNRYMIQSLEDLVDYIVEGQDHTFATGEKFEIINSKGEIVKENLISWIRSRIVALHENDPDNPINPFQGIYVNTAIRQISLNEIVNTPVYFQKRKTIIHGKEGAGGTVEAINTADHEYTELKNAMLHEAWLFGVSHSNDATYRSVRGRESELFSALGKMYANSVFTKNDRFEKFILRFAKTDRVEGQKSELQAFLDDNKQGSVGKAIQRSLVAYYYMAESIATPDQLDPKENPFYKALGPEGMKHYWQSIAESMLDAGLQGDMSNTLAGYQPGEGEDEMDKARIVLKHSELRDKISMEAAGKLGITKEDLDMYESNPEKLALKLMRNINAWSKKDMNVFDADTKDKRLVDMIHKAVAQASGRSAGLSRTDTIYAGLWAQSMVNWTGIGARNDTKALGFDAWSKLMNFDDYRLRQGSGRGGAGNILTMPGIKSLSLTFFDGIRVFKDFKNVHQQDLTDLSDEEIKEMTKKYGKDLYVPFMHLLQGGVGNDINLDKELEHFHFENNAQARYADIHINNAKNMMDFILDKGEYHLSDMFKKDSLGHLIFNHEGAKKLMDEYWKHIRYAFDQPGLLYGKEMWGWDNEVVYDKSGKPVVEHHKVKRKLVFKKKDIRHHLFGDEVINMGMYKRDGHEEENQPGHEDKMARNIFAYFIAKEILLRRKAGTGNELMTIGEIKALENFFGHITNEILVHRDNPDGSLVNVDIVDGFFNKDEWNSMLKFINSSYKRMNTEWGLLQLAGILVGGTLKTAEESSKQIFKLK